MRRRSRYDTEVGRRITQMIARACSTQREVAARIGLPYATFNQMVTGRMRPHYGLEDQVRQALAASVLA